MLPLIISLIINASVIVFLVRNAIVFRERMSMIDIIEKQDYAIRLFALREPLAIIKCFSISGHGLSIRCGRKKFKSYETND